MRLHEQRDELAGAIELALSCLGSGPPSSAYGIARDDCALVHMDYFGEVSSAGMVLAQALAAVRGKPAADIHQEFGPEPVPCDGPCCVGEVAAAEAREKHRARYTYVKEWKEASL